MIDWNALQAPFAEDELEWRLQSAGEKNGRLWGLCVPYVTNRAIQARLDEMLGPQNWRNEFKPGPDGGVVCGLSIYVAERQEWVTKWDGAENTEVEGVKGGLSSAMKRAAVQWGLGRLLYELDEAWAEISEEGRYRGKTREGRQFRWNPPRLPPWAVASRRDAAAENRLPSREEEPPVSGPSHRDLLEWISAHAKSVPVGAEFSMGESIHEIRPFITKHWPAIRDDFATAAALVEGMEQATGIKFNGE